MRGAGEVVGRRDDRPAGVRLRLEDAHQVLLGRDVDPGHRLVEQVQVGLRRERLGQEDAPALATRQGADLAIALVRHADRLERCRDGLAVLRGRAERPMPMSGTRPIIATSPTVTGNAQSTGSACGTYAIRLADARERARRTPRPSPRTAQQPGDGLEQRALARAVRADDREQRTGRDLEVDVGQGDRSP